MLSFEQKPPFSLLVLFLHHLLCAGHKPSLQSVDCFSCQPIQESRSNLESCRLSHCPHCLSPLFPLVHHSTSLQQRQVCLVLRSLHPKQTDSTCKPSLSCSPNWVQSFNNYSHTVNNLLIVFVTTFSYIGFVVLLRSKYRKHGQKFSLFKANPVSFFFFWATMSQLPDNHSSSDDVFFQPHSCHGLRLHELFPHVAPSHCHRSLLLGLRSWFGFFSTLMIPRLACPPYLYFYLNPTIRRRLKRVFGCGTRVVPRTILPPRDRSPSMRAQTVEELNLPHLMKFEKALESEA